MNTPAKLLVTFPGKLGDLLYTLPAVMQLGRHFNAPVSLQTSDYCRAAVPLLRIQPCLEDCFIDPEYRLEHLRYGCQPWRMTEPDGTGPVFHLGFRQEILGRSVLDRHLIESFFIILEKAYGLDMPRNLDEQCLFLPEEPRRDFIVFNTWGDTLMDLMPDAARQKLLEFWAALFRCLDREVVAVAGPRDAAFHRRLGMPVIEPPDLLETARLISSSACFIGVQSAAAAVANGLKTPRLIFNWFRNACPTGANALGFSLDDDPRQTAARLKAAFRI